MRDGDSRTLLQTDDLLKTQFANVERTHFGICTRINANLFLFSFSGDSGFCKNKFCSFSILFCRVRLMFNSTLFEFQLFLSLWLLSSFGIQITQRERQRRRHRCRCRTGKNSKGRKEGERKKERNKMDRRGIKRNWEGKRDGWTCLSVPHSRTTSQAKRESAVPSRIRRERKGKKEREEETNQTNDKTRLLGFDARRCVRIVERPQRD